MDIQQDTLQVDIPVLFMDILYSNQLKVKKLSDGYTIMYRIIQ
jgi:hypothetical protein